MDSAACAYSLNLMKGVLRYRPEDRPSPTVILQHIILRKNGKDLLEPDMIWTYRKDGKTPKRVLYTLAKIS